MADTRFVLAIDGTEPCFANRQVDCRFVPADDAP